MVHGCSSQCHINLRMFRTTEGDGVLILTAYSANYAPGPVCEEANRAKLDREKKSTPELLYSFWASYAVRSHPATVPACDCNLMCSTLDVSWISRFNHGPSCHRMKKQEGNHTCSQCSILIHVGRRGS